MKKASRRFTLKTLLLAVTVIAVALAAYPQIRRYIAWRSVRGELVEWVAGLERKEGKIESYMHLDVTIDPRRPNASIGSSFHVSTAAGERTVDGDGKVYWTSGTRTPVDPNRFFVIPPGKWVDTIDEIILTWDRHRADAVQH